MCTSTPLHKNMHPKSSFMHISTWLVFISVLPVLLGLTNSSRTSDHSHSCFLPPPSQIYISFTFVKHGVFFLSFSHLACKEVLLCSCCFSRYCSCLIFSIFHSSCFMCLRESWKLCWLIDLFGMEWQGEMQGLINIDDLYCIMPSYASFIFLFCPCTVVLELCPCLHVWGNKL